MTVLVTGGSGMVGKHLQEIAPRYVYLSRQQCDLTKYDEVEQAFSFYRPSHIIHLAAKVGGILQNIAQPADFYDDNIRINTNVLLAARTLGVEKFLSILTTCIYPDKVDQYPLLEADIHKGPPAAANFSYAYTKRCMAVQMDAYNRQYDLNYNYLILCNLYGEHDNFSDSNKSHFVTALIKKIIDSEKAGETSISLFGSGRPLRQFMYAGDLARVIKKTIDDGICDSFNVAPQDQNYSINQMALMALEVLNKGDWDIIYDASKPDGQFRKDVSNEKMKSCIGDFKFTSFSSGVEKVYNEIKKRSM